MFPNVVVVVDLLVGHQNLLFLLSTAHTFTVRWYWRLEIFVVLAVASSASWRFSFHLRRNLFLSPLCSSFFVLFWFCGFIGRGPRGKGAISSSTSLAASIYA